MRRNIHNGQPRSNGSGIGNQTTICNPDASLEHEPNEFKKEVEAKSKIKVVLLKPGEQFELE
jgi:hypothetical protein